MRFWLRVFLLDLRDLMRETFRYWHPDAVGRRMIRWARDLHSPFKVGDDAGTVLCSHCSNGWTGKAVEWPCPKWMKLNKELTDD